jgi:putative transposase
MRSAGTWYDNAPTENFFGTLKSERVHHLVYRAHDEARTDLFQYTEASRTLAGITRLWTI